MQYGDLRPSLKFITDLLKRIARNTDNGCCVLSPSVGTTGTIVAGSSYTKITKTNGTGTVVITFPDSTTYSLTANGSSFELPYVGGKYGAITVSSSDGGTWSWLVLTK